MNLATILVCVGLSFLVTSSNGGVVPSTSKNDLSSKDASLSHKDKLALDLPVKEEVAVKPGAKDIKVKVAFPTTTTSSTSTTTTTKKPIRPIYIDSAVFRHQFTTPSGPTTSRLFPVLPTDEDLRIAEFLIDHDNHRELGLVTDRKTETFRRGFRPASVASSEKVSDTSISSSTSAVTSSSSTFSVSSISSSTSSSSPSATATKTTTTSTTTPLPNEDAENVDTSFDYDAHFGFMDDMNPFGSELGVLGGDRRGAGLISSFRPLGF